MSNGSNAALELPFDGQADQAGEVETLPGVERQPLAANPFRVMRGDPIRILSDELSLDELKLVCLEQALELRYRDDPTQENLELLDQLRTQRKMYGFQPESIVAFFQATLGQDQEELRLRGLRPVNHLSIAERDAREAAAANPVGFQQEALKAEFKPD